MTRKRPLGRCYELSFQAILKPEFEHWILVHGRPTLTAPPFIEYGHAWLESPDEPQCYDAASDQYVSRYMYYSCGQISEDGQLRYTKHQAVTFALSHRHYGPWEGPEACPPMKQRKRKS
jgi:hypothetical protein